MAYDCKQYSLVFPSCGKDIESVFDINFSNDLLVLNSNFTFRDFPVLLIPYTSNDTLGRVWVATYILWSVSLFKSVFSWHNSSFFLKDLPFFMSLGDIDEAYRFSSIGISSFAYSTPNYQNLKVIFSSVPTSNILFNSEITFHWNVSFHLNMKSSRCIAWIPIRLPIASCQRNSALSYTLTIPLS